MVPTIFNTDVPIPAELLLCCVESALELLAKSRWPAVPFDDDTCCRLSGPLVLTLCDLCSVTDSDLDLDLD